MILLSVMVYSTLLRRGLGKGPQGGHPTSVWMKLRGYRLQRKALVRPAGLRHGLRGWPPDVHLQKRLHLRGLSWVNATLPIIGFYTGDRELFVILSDQGWLLHHHQDKSTAFLFALDRRLHCN